MWLTPSQQILAQWADLAVYILPTIGSMLLFYGIFQVFQDSKSSSRKRMQDRLAGESRSKGKSKKEVQEILRRGAVGKPDGLAEAIVGKLSIIPKLQTMLDQAAVDWSASQTLVNIGVGALVLWFGLFALGYNFIIAFGCGAGVVILPLAWLSLRRKGRMAKLANQLPDVFEMMSQALRAGHSLAGAIQLVYEQMPPPIATEFAQVYHEQNLGVKVEDALQSMAQRVDSLDVRFFVTAVMIQRQTGGDLAEVLDNISGVIRERIELAGLVRGLTAEGRLSGWVLFALPAVVFLGSMYMNPDYGTVLLEDPRGQIMLMVAVGMQLMGIAMIRWIVNIKV